MATVLITDPSHDEATKVLSDWIQSVTNYIASLNSGQHKVISLNNQDVTKTKFTEVFEGDTPELIMINGHGNAGALCGHNDEPIIEELDYDNSRYKGSVIHALACAAAKSLGQHLVNDGAKTFIGYTENFHFYHNVLPGDNATQDPVSSLFLEPAYEIPKLIAAGQTAQEAFEASQAMSQSNLLSAFRGNVDQPILASLYHNFQNHVLIGDKLANIS